MEDLEYTILQRNTPADSPVLHRLAEMEKICFPEDAWTKGMLLSSIRQPSTYVWIVKNRQLSEIVAYAVLYLAGDEGDIANIAVLPAFRHRGIGGALLDRMVQSACAAGAATLYLEVRQSNASAIRLYRSRGFAEIGKRRNYYKNPREDALLMARTLPEA